MKLLVALCLVAIVAAAPPPPTYNSNNAEILSFTNEINPDNSYIYSFEQSDGTKQEQKAEVRNGGSDNQYLAVKGYFTWIAPNGVKYIVNYTADEEGYQSEIEEGPGGPPPAVVASLLG